MENLKAIIAKYNSNSSISGWKEIEPEKIRKGGWYNVSNFPEKIEQPIIDYINCHYHVIKEDQFSITFKKV